MRRLTFGWRDEPLRWIAVVIEEPAVPVNDLRVVALLPAADDLNPNAVTPPPGAAALARFWRDVTGRDPWLLEVDKPTTDVRWADDHSGPEAR